MEREIFDRPGTPSYILVKFVYPNQGMLFQREMLGRNVIFLHSNLLLCLRQFAKGNLFKQHV